MVPIFRPCSSAKAGFVTHSARLFASEFEKGQKHLFTVFDRGRLEQGLFLGRMKR